MPGCKIFSWIYENMYNIYGVHIFEQKKYIIALHQKLLYLYAEIIEVHKEIRSK